MGLLDNQNISENLPPGHYLDTTEEEKEKLKSSSRTHDYPFAIRYAWDASALKFIFENWDSMTQVDMAKHFDIPMNSFKSVTLKKRREYGENWQRLWMEEVLTQSLELTDDDGGVKALYLIRDGSSPILLDTRETTDENGNRIYANKKAGSEGKKWKESKRERTEVRQGVKCIVGMEGDIKKVVEKGGRQKLKQAEKDVWEARDNLSTFDNGKRSQYGELPLKVERSKKTLTEELVEDDQVEKERHRKLRLQMLGADTETVPILASRHYWRSIKVQCTKEELRYFEEEWYSLMAQFASHGVSYTDECMINDLITHTLMINRILEKRQTITSQIEELEAELLIEENAGENADPVRIATIRSALTGLLSAVESYSGEYLKLQQGKEKFLRNLKATRDQRIKQVEEAKTDFFTKIELLDELENREMEGRKMAIMQESVNKELERLGSLHDYGDGDVDLPILSPETLEMLDKRDHVEKIL